MKVNLVSIGNSKGIRIPKAVLKQLEVVGKFELVVSDGCIILKPIKRPRDGWGEKMKLMHSRCEDEILMDVDDDKLEEWKNDSAV